MALKHARWRFSARSILVVAVVSGLTLFAARFLQMSLSGGSTDDAMQQFLKLPLIGVVLEEEPLAKQQLQSMMVDLASAGSTEERVHLTAKIRAFLVNLRKTYVTPALLKSEDQYILREWQAEATLIRFLSLVNTRLCKEYFISGVSNIKDLDQRGQALFMQTLQSLEDAFRNGRSQDKVQQIIGDDEMSTVMELLNLSANEIQIIRDPAARSDAEVCEATKKMYDNGMLLPERQKIPFMRRIISQS